MQQSLFKVGIPNPQISEKLKLEYRISQKGQEAWIPIDGREFSSGQLPFGKHLLEVRSTSSHNENEVLQIDIVWNPPFYRTNVFYAFIALLFIALIVLTFYQRQRTYKQNQKRLEAEVQRQTAQIRQDKELIEEQTEQLKELDKAKSRFFANISHELRTPLSLILGPITEAKRELFGNEATKRGARLLDMAQSHSDLLLRRVNELLELSRMDSGRLTLIEAPTDLQELLQEVVRRFEGASQEQQIRFVQELSVPSQSLQLDGIKLEHILNNFLSNAFKFTLKGGLISLEATADTEKLYFEVSDTGIGIPEKDQTHIFERFYQAENGREVNQQGSGIGLSLTYELVKLMKGEIKLESQEERGTRFSFDIPLKLALVDQVQKNEQESEFIQNTTIQRPNTRVLLVEDYAPLREFVQTILGENLGYTVAENGKEALTILESQDFDLILSDVMMPIMDGIELLEHIKENSKWRRIPILMLTAKKDSFTKLTALHLGADDYLTKPFLPEELRLRVLKLLEHLDNRGQLELNSELSEATNKQGWLRDLQSYVLKSLNEPIFSVESAAEYLGWSRRHLGRQLKAEIGLTATEYINELRLQKSRQLLESGHYSITEVSQKVGWRSSSYFSRKYRERFGSFPV